MNSALATISAVSRALERGAGAGEARGAGSISDMMVQSTCPAFKKRGNERMAVARPHNYVPPHRSLRQANRHFGEMRLNGLCVSDVLWPITKVFMSQLPEEIRVFVRSKCQKLYQIVAIAIFSKNVSKNTMNTNFRSGCYFYIL
jgi:hypothetical protein